MFWTLILQSRTWWIYICSGTFNVPSQILNRAVSLLEFHQREAATIVWELQWLACSHYNELWEQSSKGIILVEWKPSMKEVYSSVTYINLLYSSSSSCPCSSRIFLAVNISGTVCPIRLCKVPKEASRWARFNGAHNFGVSTPPGGENWH